MINIDKIKRDNYKCPICGLVYATPNEVAKCTADCAKEIEALENQESLKKMNEAIEEIKRLTQVRNDMLDDFKKKYPEAYEKNFGNEKDVKKEKRTRTYVNKETRKDASDMDVDEFKDFLNFLELITCCK